jgi:hypothetical protein
MILGKGSRKNVLRSPWTQKIPTKGFPEWVPEALGMNKGKWGEGEKEGGGKERKRENQKY